MHGDLLPLRLLPIHPDIFPPPSSLSSNYTLPSNSSINSSAPLPSPSPPPLHSLFSSLPLSHSCDFSIDLQYARPNASLPPARPAHPWAVTGSGPLTRIALHNPRPLTKLLQLYPRIAAFLSNCPVRKPVPNQPRHLTFCCRPRFELRAFHRQVSQSTPPLSQRLSPALTHRPRLAPAIGNHTRFHQP